MFDHIKGHKKKAITEFIFEMFKCQLITNNAVLSGETFNKAPRYKASHKLAKHAVSLNRHTDFSHARILSCNVKSTEKNTYADENYFLQYSFMCVCVM